MIKDSSPTIETDLNDEEQAKFNRLFWHSRRGMLELDLLLIPFLKKEYRNLSKEDQIQYERLIACEDPDLFKWFLRNETPEDPKFARLVKIILDRVQPG